MSMDEMLLNELYGSEETRQDEEIKQAQVELVEAVAAEAGVDLNELDDDELAKFAHYVLSDEDEVAYSDDTQQDKLAEADMIGRQMAHSYMDELNQLNGDDMSDYTQEKIASAMDDVAEAWFMQKVAAEGDDSTPGAEPQGPSKARRAINALMGHDAEGKGGGFKKMVGLEEIADDQGMLRRVGRGAGALGVAGGAGYGLYRGAKKLMGRGGSEKKASVSDMLAYELEKVAIAGTIGGAIEGRRQRRQNRDAGVNEELSRQIGVGGLRGARKGMLRDAGYTLGGTLVGGGLGALVGPRATAAGAVAGNLGSQYLSYKVNRAEQRDRGELARAMHSVLGKKKQEKKASLFLDAGYDALALAELVEPEEFAKEAEFRAAEILVANGIDPTDFSECEPENVKIASFPGVEYASDEYEAAALEEYNDMLDAAALHIIDSL